MLKNTAIAQGIAKAHPLKRIGEGKDGAALAKYLLNRRKFMGYGSSNSSGWWQV